MRSLLLLLSPLELRELILCSPNVLESNPCCFSCRPPGYRCWFPLRRYKASVSIPQLQSEELKARIRASSIPTFQQAIQRLQVQTIKQGYLLKRSSNLRGDWKRRFFVLDSHYRNKLKQGSQSQQSAGVLEHGSGVFSRFRFSHQRSSSVGDDHLWCRTVDLRTSTIKVGAEQTDLRFCFRIISPMKAYTLQAENAADRMEWIEKITGVIASLLNSNYVKV
ncbi:Pleckstrin homology domain-containing protein [Dioscorea alata]|uniref:Pleckstrin homology domain-containing protein n=3 Tax=Dioscorea alata TaxID=55571 RepID=A0ACB7V4S5_DIOAL|nr:Pleckstrin homology domain-containing protein [Dioscorea alata]KAH7668389.1 Pleckstrin homology domain-containing protein [Dioscorea alata]